MIAPMDVSTERSRFRTEREYREWQQSLRGLLPARRIRNRAGWLTRLAGRLRSPRAAA